MGVKKSAVCKSRPPPNGMNPASSRVSIPLTKPSTDPGASPLSACSRSPGANLEAQPAFVEYFVSLMRVRSSIAAEYTSALPHGLMAGDVEQAPGSSTCPQHMLPGRHVGFFSTHFLLDRAMLFSPTLRQTVIKSCLYERSLTRVVGSVTLEMDKARKGAWSGVKGLACACSGEARNRRWRVL